MSLGTDCGNEIELGTTMPGSPRICWLRPVNCGPSLDDVLYVLAEMVLCVEKPSLLLPSKLTASAWPKLSFSIPKPPRKTESECDPNSVLRKPPLKLADQAAESRGWKLFQSIL